MMIIAEFIGTLVIVGAMMYGAYLYVKKYHSNNNETKKEIEKNDR